VRDGAAQHAVAPGAARLRGAGEVNSLGVFVKGTFLLFILSLCSFTYSLQDISMKGPFMPRIPLFHNSLFHNSTFTIGSAVAVFVLDRVLLKRGSAVGDYIAAVYFAVYSAYCTANYFSCREVHCLVTGPGFLMAALLMALRIASVFDHGYGFPYLVFLAAAVLGHSIERIYARRTGSRFRGGTPQ